MYSQPKASHNKTKDMYKAIPAAYLQTHKQESTHFFQASLPTMNTILRYAFMPKSGDDMMI